jgi:CubicO group peptidase (beta-lactamase class C family)
MVETEIESKFQTFGLEERMKHWKVPGISIAVVNDGNIIWAEGFGVREYGSNEKVTKNTIFQAGSISKPIFALAAMKLKQDKQIDLDKNINEYLKSWTVPNIKSHSRFHPSWLSWLPANRSSSNCVRHTEWYGII